MFSNKEKRKYGCVVHLVSTLFMEENCLFYVICELHVLLNKVCAVIQIYLIEMYLRCFTFLAMKKILIYSFKTLKI